MRNYYAERTADNYWYTENDIVIGPVTAGVIRGLDPTSLVRKEGQTNWLRADVLFPVQYDLPSEGGKALSSTPAVLPTEPPPAPIGEWFYLYQGKTQGPVTERTIRELGHDCLVWKKGLSDWQPMSALPSARVPSYPPILTSIVSVSPTISGYHAASPELANPSDVSNEIVWFWAFVPLLSGVLPMIPVYVWWLVHTFLWFIDGQFIKSAGRDRRRWGFWGWAFPPVYLFLRASRLKQNNAYAWVFLVCALISCVLLFSTAVALANRG
jgi:hypothetical protein